MTIYKGVKVIKQIQICQLSLLIYLSIPVGLLFTDSADAETRKEWMAKVVSVQGNVQAKKKDEMQWKPIKLNDTYNIGDMIRVQERSRAAILISTDTLIRLNENTTITFSGREKKKLSLLDILAGGVHFLSRMPWTLKVTTPFVDGTVEGTEFLVNVGVDRTSLTVFEGQVLATNKAGSLTLKSGHSAIARAGQAPVPYILVRPRDAVQWALYYPPVIYYRTIDFPDIGKTKWQAMVLDSIQSYWKGDLKDAFSSIEKITEKISDPRFFNYRASLLLTVGRVDEARLDVERVLNLVPGNSHAIALQSIIAVAQNDKDRALSLAQKAIETDPRSATARIAFSYAQQANYDIDGALESLQEAVKRDAANALAWARLGELWLSKGYLNKAGDAAQEAVTLNPNLARTQTVLGFAYLTQIKIRDSKNAFEKAIELDQADSLPRLGLGLAKIREGNLKEGRGEIEIAAILDPNNSLIRSYLGKAYFEEKRDKKASGQLDIARELDPQDPTPWFYDAIRKQTVNRPVEALHDMQKSIELNENRVIYRSRLLLDEDLASRSASIGRIYKDLGFQQRALIEGWKSLNVDPSNYSAHRFLADTYSALPRHEIARVSELLQSQLLQPINITPIQPQLAESNLFILEGSGPQDPSFNEYNPLFNRNRLALQANGVIAERDTVGNDLVQSGVLGRMSYSLGQFHYETGGFRRNNGLNTDIYNAFFQASLSHKTSVQAEYRFTDTEKGDLELRFDPNNFRPDQRQESEVDNLRLGLHHSFTPNSDFIASFIYFNLDSDTKNILRGPSPSPLGMSPGFESDLENDGWTGEIRHLYRSQSGRFHVTGGIGRNSSERNNTSIITFPPPQPPRITQGDFDIRHTNFYVYSLINFLENFTWTIGGSVDFFEGIVREYVQGNPKFGLTWDLLPGTTLRAAAFRTLKRQLLSDQTIEPTQVAGFNQFFDDPNGTEAWRYGVAVDQKFSKSLYGGAEYSRRDMEIPFIRTSPTTTVFSRLGSEEELIRAYLYWTPHRWLSLSAEYQYEWLERARGLLGPESFHKIKTNRVPLGINFFHPSGFSARLKATYIDQDGKFGDPVTGGTFVVPGDDQFWVFDGSISYRLPKRWGIISIGAKNLFDEEFKFQDTDPTNPVISPDQLIFARFTFSY
ncbi:MAG: TonB-dependent receptor domain-containing protein [Candidatus Scalinduaceae bacterium]